MCTKILKKESSSRALAFFMLMFMMPLGFIGNTQNCEAMQHDQAENSPLLGRVDTSINGNGSDVEQGRNNLISVAVQSDDLPPKIVIPDGLLKELDSRAAVEAMKIVKKGLRYADAVDAKDDDAVEEIFQEVMLLKICNLKDDLGEKLLARAIDDADIVQKFFTQNRDKIQVLIKTVENYEEFAEKLKKLIIQEREDFANEQRNLHAQNKKNLEENKSLKSTRTILAICLPVAVGVTGLCTWAIMMYWGGHSNR
jgi:hypothetical protein